MDEHTSEPTSAPVPTPASTEDSVGYWGTHRLALLLIGTVIVTVVLTVVSMVLYRVSGAAQLDLSRPGYQSVSNQVDETARIDIYSSSGSVNKDTITEFMKLYDEQAARAKAVNAFNGDPLNPEVLEFSNESSN